MDGMEYKLDQLQASSALIRVHIERTCELARSVNVLLRPVIWIAQRVRGLAIWIAAFAAAVITVLALGDRFHWW